MAFTRDSVLTVESLGLPSESADVIVIAEYMAAELQELLDYQQVNGGVARELERLIGVMNSLANDFS